jgi:hypothetical protein
MAPPIDTALPSVKFVIVGQDGTHRALTTNGQAPTEAQLGGAERLASAQGRGAYVAKLTVAQGVISLEKHSAVGDPKYGFEEAAGNFNKKQKPAVRGNSNRVSL